MAQRIPTRLGDGSLVEMTRAEIEADLHAGSEAAVKRAKVEPLAQDELDHLLDIFTSPAKFSARRLRRRSRPRASTARATPTSGRRSSSRSCTRTTTAPT